MSIGVTKCRFEALDQKPVVHPDVALRQPLTACVAKLIVVPDQHLTGIYSVRIPALNRSYLSDLRHPILAGEGTRP